MKVAVAVDGSESSNGALSLAKYFPLAASEITIIHVKPQLSFDEVNLAAEVKKEIEAFDREINAKADQVIKHSREYFASSKTKVNLVVKHGDPAENILHVLEDRSIELLVIGARGLSPIQSFLVGSTADTVMRHAHCSVLLYRGKGGPLTKAVDTLSMVVGYDGSASSQQAIAHVQRWDLNRVANIHLVSFAQMSFYYGMTYSMAVLSAWPAHRQSLEENLAAAEGEIQQVGPGVKVTTEIVANTHDVAHELMSYAKTHGAQMIAVGSKGKNLLDRIMLGSVSNKLAHHAEVPVLIVRT